MQILRDKGGTASLDEIIVGLYRKFGVEKMKRQQVASKINRMESRKDLVTRIPKRRGLYTIPQTSMDAS